MFSWFSSNKSPTVSLEDITSAASRLASTLPVTPLTYSPILSRELKREVHLKWENRLFTGSFKERGALNFLLTLDEESRKRGVCAASAGNHARALSYHAQVLKIPCTLVMPTTAPLVKVESSRAQGAEIILHGEAFHEALQHALGVAKSRKLTFVPAYDHPAIIAGQGTVGLEIASQLPAADAIVVPVGGGGLAAGSAIALRAKLPKCYLLGVQSSFRQDLARASKSSIRPMSIADGIAVKSIGDLPKDILESHLDQIVTVSENSIAHALVRLLEWEHAVVEGAGAAAVAALLEGLLPEHLRTVVLIISGSNIDTNLLSRLIDRSMAESGRLLRLQVAVPDRPGALRSITKLLADHGANIVQVVHDRSFSALPGNVDITLQLEVRNFAHQKELIAALADAGLAAERAPGVGGD
jgi:threonine dehydratase